MNLNVFFMIPALIIFIALIGLGIYVSVLIVKTLHKYTKSESVNGGRSPFILTVDRSG